MEVRVCVVSESAETADAVLAAVKDIPNSRATKLDSSIGKINGEAANVLGKNDAIFLDMTDVDETTIQRIEAMLKSRPETSSVFALTDANISLSAARQLQSLGIDDVIPLPLREQDVSGAVYKIIADRKPKLSQASGASKVGRVVGIGHAAGGSGATTIAVNLALILLDRRGMFKKTARSRVAILDFNPQFGAVASSLDLDGARGLLALAESGDVPDQVFVQSLITSLDSGLDVIAAPVSPIPVDAYEPDQIAAVLEILRADYDYVVVDMPSFVVGWESALLEKLDHLYMVSNLSVPAILSTRRMVEFFKKIDDALPVDVIINRDRKPTFGSRRLSDAQTVLDCKVAFWIAADEKAAREATDLGKPAAEGSPGSAMVKSIRNLAKSIEKLTPRSEIAAADEG